MARSGQFKHFLLLHVIIYPYIFILCVMFRLNAENDNDDIYAFVM